MNFSCDSCGASITRDEVVLFPSGSEQILCSGCWGPSESYSDVSAQDSDVSDQVSDQVCDQDLVSEGVSEKDVPSDPLDLDSESTCEWGYRYKSAVWSVVCGKAVASPPHDEEALCDRHRCWKVLKAGLRKGEPCLRPIEYRHGRKDCAYHNKEYFRKNPFAK